MMKGPDYIRFIFPVFLCMLCVQAVAAVEQVTLPGNNPGEAAITVPSTSLSDISLFFVPNEGQAGQEVLFTCKGEDYSIYYARDKVAYSLPYDTGGRYWIIQRFSGGNPGPLVEGLDPLETRVNYFTGPEAGWYTDITPFSSIKYRDVYPGIDLIYRGMSGSVKREFLVSPGADPYRIRFTYEGAGQVRMSGEGGLVIAAGSGEIRETPPVCYQEVDGSRIEVPCRFDVREDGSVSFYVGAYDNSLPLMIDPLLVYCGYVGGSDNDYGRGIAVDSSRNAYITGYTSSTASSFPDTVGPDRSYNGNIDAFVAKVNAAGTGLTYCGYIGGDKDDRGRDIAVDSNGNAYIVGYTQSNQTTFPVVTGPDLTFNLGSDAFVAKVNSAGNSLTYCGYIGGVGNDYGYGIDVDPSGNAYIGGRAGSSQASFPVVTGPDQTFNGFIDGFVAKVNSAGDGLVYCGYIGGAGNDEVWDIAVDSIGNAFVTGVTDSDETSFPVRISLDNTYNGNIDAFVAQVNSAGNNLGYCGYIGGSGYDAGTGVAYYAASQYYTGYTESTEATFPVLVGPDLTHNGGTNDAYVAKITSGPGGTGLVYCGYIGGSSDDIGNGIDVDSQKNAYVTGATYSTAATFPETLGPDLTPNGGQDAFVARVVNGGASLLYCSYLGGSGYEEGYGVAVDNMMNAYIVGGTGSTAATFPETVGPDLVYNGGISDAFVAKIALRGDRIGLFRPANSRFFLDYDNNGASDLQVTWGESTDIPLAGDWDNDGLDEIGLWRPSTAAWYLDYDNSGGSDFRISWGASTDIPVTGDWDNDGFDEIGLWRPSTVTWYLDYDNSGGSDFAISWGDGADLPVTGDWDNDGSDEIGLWRPSTARWYMDYDNNGLSDLQRTWGANTDKPITGDWDEDGFDEIGLWRPSTARWYLDYDNNGVSDFQVAWGASTDKPLTGKWT